MKEYIVTKEEAGLRLDKYLKHCLPDQSRSHLVKCIEEEKVLVNDQKMKPSYLVLEGDRIVCGDLEVKPLLLEAKNLKLDIVYEDEDVAVVNKPKGMVVHPGCGNTDDTLVHGLLWEIKDLAINGSIRPGIVHRIDKDTTGLLMIAKNDQAQLSLTEQLKNHTCNRRYIALVYGTITENKGKINAPIGRDKDDRKKMAVTEGGKPAVTHFTVLKRYRDFTLVSCQLETGRTHQIRVHFQYIGHPLVGDAVYGRRKVIGQQGQFLHAERIGFHHPKTGVYLEFTAPIPPYFQAFLDQLDVLE